LNRTSTESRAIVYTGRISLIIGACFILSGATGLIYEVLWARMLGLVFGATTFAISTVLAAFMGGLAIGSALSGRLAKDLRKPLRVYGLLEIGIAIYALAVPLLFHLVDLAHVALWSRFQAGFLAFSLGRFVLASAVLLIPTALMGATLPVLAGAILRSDRSRSTAVAALYNCNLLGAIAGALIAGFVLLPEFGVKATIWTAAVINFVIGGVAIWMESRNRPETPELIGEAASDEEPDQPASPAASTTGSSFWWWCALTSGFVTIGIQVAWSRVLSMVIGSSTYAFSLVVALFLTGLALGAFLVARRKKFADLRRTVFRIELAAAISLVVSLAVINLMPNLLIRLGLSLRIGAWWSLLALQSFTAGILILVPATLLGLVMPLVLVWANEVDPATAVRRVGRLYAANTLGAIAGAVLTGFVLIPQLGLRMTVMCTAAICIVVAAAARPASVGRLDPELQRALGFGTALIVIVALPFVAPRLNLANLSVGAYDGLVRILARTRYGGAEREQAKSVQFKLLAYYEGPTATVSVGESEGVRFLSINGRTNASDRDDMPTQVMVGQLPLLVAPHAENGLMVGYASGVSVGSLLQSDIKSVDCVELEPRTLDAGRFFEHVNHRPLSDPRLHMTIDDARAFLRVTPKRYDVLVSEPSHPWVPGVANLFTREFFTLGRDRLSEGGVFVQWVQIYQLSTESLRSVLATFQGVFPHVMVFRVGGGSTGKDLILLGSQRAMNLDGIDQRLADPLVRAELARINVRSRADVESWYVCDEVQLAPAVAGAVINTDDNMRVETRAPREAFLPLMETNAAWIENLASEAKRVTKPPLKN
jgi:spermidine synthase